VDAERAKRCPAASATSARSAIAATAHGRAFEPPSARPAAAAPAGVPQRWQNLAPGVRGARQDEHAAPASGAPQLAQNFPSATAPQDGHGADETGGGVAGEAGEGEGEVIGVKSKRR
jgi:hypothetical protein